MTNENNHNVPLNVQVGNKLISLKAEITADDRKAFMRADNISKVCLSRYLNGRVNDVDRGIRMKEFFEKRIQARAKRIAKSIAA